MTEIILARHGETEWNVEEIFRGRIDVELNETGMKQAELLAEYLSDVKIDAIYSSPLKRALKTAEVIASYHQLNVEITPGLIDFDFGEICVNIIKPHSDEAELREQQEQRVASDQGFVLLCKRQTLLKKLYYTSVHSGIGQEY